MSARRPETYGSGPGVPKRLLDAFGPLGEEDSPVEQAPVADADGWLPIETAPKTGQYIWLAKPYLMRIGFWADGRQHENFGTKGGGWIDMAAAEGGGPRGLRFEPTHWMPLPAPPEHP